MSKLLRQKYISPILLFYFVLLSPQLFFNINHGHAWRQADTWAIAKSFAFESPNFLYPRVDVRKDTSGIDAIDSRGWVIEKNTMHNRAEVSELIQKGAKWFINKDENSEEKKYNLYDASEWLEKITP